MKYKNGFAEIFKEEIIHDKEVYSEVFFNAYTELRFLRAEIDKAKEDGYIVIKGEFTRGKEFKKLLAKKEIEYNLLERMFGEEAKKYKIEY